MPATAAMAINIIIGANACPPPHFTLFRIFSACLETAPELMQFRGGTLLFISYHSRAACQLQSGWRQGNRIRKFFSLPTAPQLINSKIYDVEGISNRDITTLRPTQFGTQCVPNWERSVKLTHSPQISHCETFPELFRQTFRNLLQQALAILGAASDGGC
jgi:hypothetical protein